jgi:hypothetical protein
MHRYRAESNYLNAYIRGVLGNERSIGTTDIEINYGGLMELHYDGTSCLHGPVETVFCRKRLTHIFVQ